ncbi:MAG: hypothetical protein QOK13_68 [Gaiellaceae bacterium]|nr:hypothetical protein [Gaiellaceae bacterium]MDX6542625.1 hypothetical protein [Gaiellaceae bacterium]
MRILRIRPKRRRSVLAALVVAGVVGSAAYAFTATNTVPASTAGSGSGAISGYTVSAIAYTLNSTTPTNLDAVAFTIAPTAAAVVKIQLAAAGSWYTCANAAGSVTCNTTSPQATVAAATNLTVVATQ